MESWLCSSPRASWQQAQVTYVVMMKLLKFCKLFTCTVIILRLGRMQPLAFDSRSTAQTARRRSFADKFTLSYASR